MLDGHYRSKVPGTFCATSLGIVLWHQATLYLLVIPKPLYMGNAESRVNNNTLFFFTFILKISLHLELLC